MIILKPFYLELLDLKLVFFDLLHLQSWPTDIYVDQPWRCNKSKKMQKWVSCKLLTVSESYSDCFLRTQWCFHKCERIENGTVHDPDMIFLKIIFLKIVSCNQKDLLCTIVGVFLKLLQWLQKVFCKIWNHCSWWSILNFFDCKPTGHL